MSQHATEAERWAAEELRTLRTAHFAPSAVNQFLRASFRRAAVSRAQRPGLTRQSRRWVITGTIGGLAAREAANRCGRPVPTRQATTVWLAIVSLMLHWHLGMVQGLGGEPREHLTIADALTLTRAAIAPFAAAAPPDPDWFTLLIGVASVTDLLDGQLARRAGVTRLGRDFDSLTDSAFRIAALRGARRAGWIDDGAHRALIARQVLLATRAIWYWFARSNRPPAESSPVARWHVPLMLVGLVIGAHGNRRRASQMLIAAALLGSCGGVRRSQRSAA